MCGAWGVPVQGWGAVLCHWGARWASAEMSDDLDLQEMDEERGTEGSAVTEALEGASGPGAGPVGGRLRAEGLKPVWVVSDPVGVSRMLAFTQAEGPSEERHFKA